MAQLTTQGSLSEELTSHSFHIPWATWLPAGHLPVLQMQEGLWPGWRGKGQPRTRRPAASSCLGPSGWHWLHVPWCGSGGAQNSSCGGRALFSLE